MGQVLVERYCFPIVLDQKKLVNPVDEEKVDASYRVKDRHAARVSEHTPKCCKELSVNVRSVDFFSSV